MGRYQHYPDYKQSRVEWLGDIPDHWNIKKLKFVASIQPSNVDKKSKEDEQRVNLCNYTDVYYNENINASMAFMKATATKEQIKKFTLQAGDTIITKDSEDPRDIAVPSYVPEDLPGVICGYHLAMIRPKNPDIGQYIKRVFETGYARSYFSTRANGLTRYGLGAYPLSNILFPIPPKDEAQTIAAFLDHETAKIDRLITRQGQLIELLKEKRQAVISHAVTKGLNPDVPMKDSGVESLGEVPAHWGITQLQRIVDPTRQIMYGIVLPGPNVDEGVPIVKGGDVKPGRLKLSSLCRTTYEIESGYARSRLRAGDLVYSIRGTIGDVEIVPQEIEGANLTQDAARIAPAKGIQNAWLRYTLEADPVFRQLEIGSLGAAVKGINIRDLKKAMIPFPPLDERDFISSYLDKMLDKLELLQGKALTQIDLLREHRSALISAAVTGKIDVRGWQKPNTESKEAATAASA